MYPHAVYVFDPLRRPRREDEAAAAVLFSGMAVAAFAAAGAVALVARAVGGW